jgi:feruloyl esterase
MLTPLVAWVEQGKAPDSVQASVRGAGCAGGVNADLPAAWSATRTRPLCPYPKAAKYKGSGSIEDAASFRCGRRYTTIQIKLAQEGCSLRVRDPRP